jgi:hypothetical protein
VIQDSSGSSEDWLGAIGTLAGSGQKISGWISGWQSLFGGQARGSGRMAARGAAAYALAQAKQGARVAAKQFQFQQAQAFPESPVYGPQAVITQFDVKPKLATKRTNVLQAMMSQPDSKKLQAKLVKIDKRIARSVAQHPESATQYAVTRKY